ncbi:hypothetical protein K503DRAFT_530044 [Rhizopogon vinicolor AM-OR11-026]|uniref:Uncharacterized protein n=1 Tax=Rhizopogon vinicolor AM-OR11-026 TaxID=1314800 RepID=A0A1B7ML63_9AGAM|nr:hypothetical protein K503DRAFT_530044 [Rhizopogon vinicolor AM-OR11-026]
MKGVMSFVFVVIAFLQVTVAAPAISERSTEVEKRADTKVNRGIEDTGDYVEIEEVANPIGCIDLVAKAVDNDEA